MFLNRRSQDKWLAPLTIKSAHVLCLSLDWRGMCYVLFAFAGYHVTSQMENNQQEANLMYREKNWFLQRIWVWKKKGDILEFGQQHQHQHQHSLYHSSSRLTSWCPLTKFIQKSNNVWEGKTCLKHHPLLFSLVMKFRHPQTPLLSFYYQTNGVCGYLKAFASGGCAIESKAEVNSGCGYGAKSKVIGGGGYLAQSRKAAELCTHLRLERSPSFGCHLKFRTEPVSSLLLFFFMKNKIKIKGLELFKKLVIF